MADVMYYVRGTIALIANLAFGAFVSLYTAIACIVMIAAGMLGLCGIEDIEEFGNKIVSIVEKVHTRLELWVIG